MRPFSSLSDEELSKTREAEFPQWTAPMLATLTHDHFSDSDWLFERKLDGERILVFRNGRRIDLMTRNRKRVNDTYPELADALAEQDCSEFVIDGEVVAFSGNRTSFSRLQKRMQIKDRDKALAAGTAVWLYVFDMMYCAGHRLEKVPLRARKKVLKSAMEFKSRLRYTPHRNESGEAYLEVACRKGWEGLIAKRADSTYQHSRSRDWLKFKCEKGQELVIAGFTEPRGDRVGFGALLVGYYEDDQLHYAGKVGTGFDDRFLREFREQLGRHEQEDSPFAKDSPEGDDVNWVQPRFVGEFGFTEWTEQGKLRHPRFLGLRRDKSPRDVVRE